ncbi:MAG: VWA domain-containing protein, partial [Planctomycetales bacterium]|nr:VWA domain-containing protein [Planctomycetales bacterium]
MSIPDPSIDEQLRDVPLPSGLHARLRQLGTWTDELIDEELRGVPLTSDLLVRCKNICDDVLLDDLLHDASQSVPLPDGLLARCKDICADELLDEQLADLPVPASVLAQARIVPLRRQRRHPVLQFATAACLLLALCGGYLTALQSLLRPIWSTQQFEPSIVWIHTGSVEVEGGLSAPPVAMATFENLEPEEVAPSVESVDVLPPSLVMADKLLPEGPAGQLFTALRNDFRPWDDVLLMQWGPLGYPSRANDDLPDLEAVPVLRTTTTQPPLSRGYDRSFLYRTGKNPVIFPGLARDLARTQFTPVTDTTSWELAQNLVRDNRRPRSQDIHVEEFLAAFDYGFAPAPTESLDLRIAAGPAHFHPQGASLIQVGVQAGAAHRRMQQQTHLIIGLDLSASMRFGHRLQAATTGIRRLLKDLTPQDDLSLVLFNDQIVQTVEHVSTESIGDLEQLLSQLEPAEGTDLPAALQHCASLAMGYANPDKSQRLVILTDDPAELPPATQTALGNLLRETRRCGVS